MRLHRAPDSVLVVVTRRIGDVFLTGALVRSLRQAWPSSRIDMLVFQGTEGVLGTQPDVSSVLIAPQSDLRKSIALVQRLWKSYDIAISTSPSDRPTLYALAAGKHSIGVMAAGRKHLWKSALLSGTVPFDNSDTHTVVQNLLLADALGVERAWQLPLAWSSEDEQAIEQLLPGYRMKRYAALHPYPKFRYKMWNPDAWRVLMGWLHSEGLHVALTGGPDPDEVAYVSEVTNATRHSVTNLAGKLDFRALAVLLSRAALYVGPDTVTTHLAAASGVPTVALFGPSNPVKWGPWPRNWSAAPSPWQRKGTQFVGNVALVQGQGHCVPCLEEGCARHVESESACLQMMTVETVISAIERLWATDAR